MGMSIGSVFAAGIVPGILVGVLLMVAVYVYAAQARLMLEYESPIHLAGFGSAFLVPWSACSFPQSSSGNPVGVFTLLKQAP